MSLAQKVTNEHGIPNDLLDVEILLLFEENPVLYSGVLVGGVGEELEDLGYIEPIEPNRGTPRATKLVNFNMLNHHQAHNIKMKNKK